jgi:hypothetical protein
MIATFCGQNFFELGIISLKNDSIADTLMVYNKNQTVFAVVFIVSKFNA